MRLRDLLDIPSLGLELLWGTEEQLDRSLRWVCTTDLLDPGRYLSGGELVISGLLWRHHGADSERFLNNISAAGAAALAVGTAGESSTVPPDLVDACQRHDVPLVWVAADVAFAQITEQVVAAVTVGREAQLRATLGRQRRLLGAFADGQDLPELTKQLGQDTGLVCRVITPTGRHVVAGDAPLSDADLDRVTRAFLTAERLPAVAAGRGRAPYSIFPAGPSLAHRPSTWFVVVDGTWSQWEPALVDAVGELAAIVALHRARREESQRIVHGIADDALALLESDKAVRHETLVRLGQAGVDTSGEVLVAVAAVAGRPDQVEVARSMLEDLVALIGPPVVGATRDGRAVALVPLTRELPDPLPLLRSGIARLAPGLGRSRFVIGVGAPAASDALSGGLEEAKHASVLAENRGGEVSLVASQEVTSYGALLAMVPDELRRAFAARVVGPVLEYDERTDAGLRETLYAFLDNSGSWSRTAEAMHLHVNTVRYRIGRVEELTGRDMSKLEDRVDVFLALRSL
jgi:purine catabolism regulatory family protein/PucR-like helix-turn-helix protein/diguanylate cyclase with GGDEF domain